MDRLMQAVEWVLSQGKRSADDGLVERAAGRNRVDILDILLSRGGNVNRLGSGRSPLEAAMEGCAHHSVERLLQEPELDVTLTKRLLNCWSLADSGRVGLDFCLQAAALPHGTPPGQARVPDGSGGGGQDGDGHCLFQGLRAEVQPGAVYAGRNAGGHYGIFHVPEGDRELCVPAGSGDV